jgi:hypothetical protein
MEDIKQIIDCAVTTGQNAFLEYADKLFFQVWTVSHEDIKTVRVAGGFGECARWIDANDSFINSQKLMVMASSDRQEWEPCTIGGFLIRSTFGTEGKYVRTRGNNEAGKTD